MFICQEYYEYRFCRSIDIQYNVCLNIGISDYSFTDVSLLLTLFQVRIRMNNIETYLQNRNVDIVIGTDEVWFEVW